MLIVPLVRQAAYAAANGIGWIDLLKLDVQGFELEVLKGAAGIRVGWICAEAWFQELYAGGPMFDETAMYLHERGFNLVQMC